MARTITQVQTELDTINAALQELIAGTRLTRLRIGSDDSLREYNFLSDSYTNIYNTLIAEKDALTLELNQLSGNTEMTFRKSSHVKLTVTKFGY